MRSIYSSAALAVALLWSVPTIMAQGGRGQAAPPDPAALQRGKDAYAANCAACHGTDARGGRGPDLAHSLTIVGDPTGKALGAFARVGNVANGMPPINLTDAEFKDITTFVLAEAQTQMARRPADAAAVLVGDAKAGEAFFNGAGKCVTCHSVTGNLKGVGTKYSAQDLQRRIVYPRGRGSYPGFGQAVADPPFNATATLADGRKISGAVVTLSDYLVTIQDTAGKRYTVPRTDASKVQITDPIQAHVDRMKTLTDQQMHDLTAYLAGIK